MKFRNISFSFKIIKVKLQFIKGQLNNFNAKWWGINIGKNVKFNGRCNFERFPGTEIFIGDNCKFLSRANSNLIGINRPCSIATLQSEFKAKLVIGNNCGFSGTVIGAFKLIRIGNNVKCGANTLITDSDWHLDDFRSGECLDIIIEDNVWLGINVVVLKGVTIGENSLIGANSVVTKSIPKNVIAAGNPCKVIKYLTIVDDK
jgi:acetyltransferase-like isoleucine patch superfamily enzyme